MHFIGTPTSGAEKLTAYKGEVVAERLGTMRFVDPAVIVFNEEEQHFLQERRIAHTGDLPGVCPALSL